MFNWPIFAIITISCVPGLIVVLPLMAHAIYQLASKIGKKMPSKQFIYGVTFAQNLIYCALASALGTYFSYKVGLQDPFLDALVTGKSNLLHLFLVQIKAALICGIPGAAIFLCSYYFIFRPRLDSKTADAMDHLRTMGGFWGRILYGGWVEEVLARFGLQSFLVWLGSLIVGSTSEFINWFAIIIAGFFFVLGHIPGYRIAGCTSTMFIITAFTLNMWASLIFGWLFWHYGLIAAAFAHMLLHIIWMPVEYFRRKLKTH